MNEGLSKPAWVSTNELAEQLRGKPESIRVRLCQTGSYHGIKPLKLPGGRLLWPADSLERLTRKMGGGE